eukprot:4423603-Amphidinium_carterae.1
MRSLYEVLSSELLMAMNGTKGPVYFVSTFHQYEVGVDACTKLLQSSIPSMDNSAAFIIVDLNMGTGDMARAFVEMHSKLPPKPCFFYGVGGTATDTDFAKEQAVDCAKPLAFKGELRMPIGEDSAALSTELASVVELPPAPPLRILEMDKGDVIVPDTVMKQWGANEQFQAALAEMRAEFSVSLAAKRTIEGEGEQEKKRRKGEEGIAVPGDPAPGTSIAVKPLQELEGNTVWGL